MNRTLCAVTLCWLATSLAAQRTWIVDASGKGDFTKLAPALAAARDGDTVRIRAGVYEGGETSKALRILGESAIIVTPRSGHALRIHSLPKGKQCVIKGLTTLSPWLPFSPTFLRIESCLGHVVCDNITARIPGLTRDEGGRAVEVRNCAHVTFHRCQLSGRQEGSMVIEGSTVVLDQCTVEGKGCLSANSCQTPTGPAITVRRSTLVLAECLVIGGPGGKDSLTQLVVTPAPAVRSTDSFVTISGSANSKVSAGSGNVSNASVWAIEGSGGGVQYDPRVRVLGTGPYGSAVYAAIPARTLRLPAIVDAIGAPPGGKVTFDLLATNGDLAELYVSLPGYPWQLPIADSGQIWIDPATLIVLGRAAIGQSDRVSWTVPVPNLSVLQGLALELQAVTASGQTIRFSTPAHVVLD